MQYDLPPPKILEIRKYPDAILKQSCLHVSEINLDIKTLIQNMFLTMYSSGGVGLSANQVGRLERVFVMDTSASGSRRRAFINPEIIRKSNIDKCKEGCLSFPDIFAFVKRPTNIKIRAQDEDGNTFELDLEGIDAICFQHELDHLNGITFYDHLSPLQKQMMKKKMSKLGK